MRRSSAASRSGSAVLPGFSGAQNTPATASPRSRNASSTALPKSLCPTMAIRITKSPWSPPTPSYDISYIISPNLSVQLAKRVSQSAQQRRSYGRSQLSVRSRTHQRARPRAARHGGGDGRPPLADLPRTDPGLPERLEAGVQDHLRQPHSLPVLRHRLLGSSPHQLPEPRGQDSDLAFRAVQPSVGGHVYSAGFRGRDSGDSLGRRRSGGALSLLAQAGQTAPDQGGIGVPERDRDRRDQRRRRRAPGDGQRQAPGAAVRGLGERAGQH